MTNVNATPLIQFKHFSFSFNKNPVLDDISITISKGEKVALLGPSGAGKSTLLMAMYEQLQHSAALCPQHLGLVDSLSVFHNIYMGQLNRHSTLYNFWNLLIPFKNQREAITELSKGLGIEHLIWKPASQLSGGERQRVALARAFYKTQDVFIGDEPVTGLDPNRSQSALNDILNLHNTVVVALHDPQMALSQFDRIIGIQAGKIVFDRNSTQSTNEHLQFLYSQE